MKKTDAARARRLKWFIDAKLGMFIHYGAYSQLGRGEWVMNRERIPAAEYERYADSFAPRARCPREWARLAKKAGMGYLVMTTKHHEGFSLWDSEANPYNSVKRGNGRDVVADFVAACREFGLKCGFYYSLMDWHHPDGYTCAKDPAARRRFLDYTQALVRELMTNYGKIDILWYDIPLPLDTPEAWESAKMNAIARKLQPHILINDRSYIPEDFGQSEGGVNPIAGRAWECCTTTANGWGYMPTPPDEWWSARKMARTLRDVLAGGGNLLLNIGPEADGTIPAPAVKRFTDFGKWARAHAEAIYGPDTRIGVMEGTFCGQWTQKGKMGYYWVNTWWPGGELAIGGLQTKVKNVWLMPSGRKLRFRQEPDRIFVYGLPARCPDTICQIGMLKFEFVNDHPVQKLGPCMFPV